MTFSVLVVKIVLLDQYSFIISPETGLVYLLNLLEQNNSIVVFFEHQTQVYGHKYLGSHFSAVT